MFLLCDACRRHVKATATTCPFCATAIANVADESDGHLDEAPNADRPLVDRNSSLGSASLCVRDSSLGSASLVDRKTRSRAQRYALGAAIAASIGIAKASGQESAPRAIPPSPSASTTPIAVDAEDAAAAPQLPPDVQTRASLQRGGDRSCTTTGGGCCGGPAKVSCPPYGCVFPDDACDVVRV